MQDTRKGEIFSHLLRFARRLKEEGLKITPGRVIDAARCLELIDLSIRRDFAETLKANFISSREHLSVFDELFEEFWSQMREALGSQIVPSEEGTEGEGVSGEKTLARPEAEESAAEREGAEEEKLITGYSPQEVLTGKDLSQFAPEDWGILERELARLLSQLATKVSRRRKPSAHGREMDFRRSMKRAARYGGEWIELIRRKPKIKPLKVIVICDVSGSMDASTRFLLRFLFGMEKAFKQSEFFVFSTRLTRITDIFRRNRWTQALADISGRVQDWSGGTQIGHCLKIFNERYARGMAAGSPVIILISDGWDRGEPELLEKEMKRLRRRSRRLIWLNPLLGTPDYQPLCQGMRTALPYLDYFLPATTLKGLKVMGDVLLAQSAKG
jgi:uncharacterized protein